MAMHTQLSPRPMPDEAHKRSNTSQRRRSIWGPAVLILIGLLFLLSNLNALPNNGWHLVWTYWPVLLLIASLDDLLRGNFGGAILNLGFGAILLLINLGVLSGWGLWDLMRLWPVFLIIGGIGILSNGMRSPLASVLSGVMALAILFGVLLWVHPTMFSGTLINDEPISQSLDGAHRAAIKLVTIGTLRVSAMSEPNGLIDGVVKSQQGQSVQRNFTINGDSASLDLQLAGAGFYLGPDTASKWDLRLNPSVPINLNVKLDVGDANLQLDKLYVTQLQVNTGVGTSTITLPDSGTYRAEVKGGIGETTLIIPKGLAARIQVKTDLGNLVLPADLLHRGDIYFTPNYDEAESRVDLQVEQDIGQVTVQMK